jgi:hypothetical protein
MSVASTVTTNPLTTVVTVGIGAAVGVSTVAVGLDAPQPITIKNRIDNDASHVYRDRVDMSSRLLSDPGHSIATRLCVRPMPHQSLRPLSASNLTAWHIRTGWHR